MLREQSAINPTLPLTAMGASSWETPTIIESCREHHSCPQTRCKKTHRVMCDACRACVCIAADHHAHARARASRQESASFYARTHARTTRIAFHMMSMFISELINSFDINHFARRWVRCEVAPLHSNREIIFHPFQIRIWNLIQRTTVVDHIVIV